MSNFDTIVFVFNFIVIVFHFIIFCLVIFCCYLFSVGSFIMRNRNGVNPEGRRGGRKLGEGEREGTILHSHTPCHYYRSNPLSLPHGLCSSSLSLKATHDHWLVSSFLWVLQFKNVHIKRFKCSIHTWEWTCNVCLTVSPFQNDFFHNHLHNFIIFFIFLCRWVVFHCYVYLISIIIISWGTSRLSSLTWNDGLYPLKLSLNNSILS